MDNVRDEDCMDLAADSDDNGGDSTSNIGVDMNEGNNNNDNDQVFKKVTDLSPEDIFGLEFDSEDAACDFYYAYARCRGFVVRKDDVGKDAMGKINMRQLVCNREGQRNKRYLTNLDRTREHKPLTRTNCPARFRVHIDGKSSKWIVAAFEESHNHHLISPEQLHLIPSYRSMSNVDKAQVDSLHLYGVRTCHIMGLMLGQKGGHADLGFCKKDLYNHIDRQKRANIEDGDAFAALSYLQAKADNDPMSFAKFTTTSDGRLQHLFWADGASRVDYDCFGDVLAFDTTYKKNKYNKPLVIFCGYNHHGQTAIFGCALVDDEKTETYKWVLETFSEVMCNKHPTAVVTDGDNAMREAIKIAFPNATHRLCSWHLQQNGIENVKNPKFLEEFKTLIYANFSPNEFEDRWTEVLVKYHLHNNKWANKIYNMKDMWAAAYLRDKLFCGIRTTSMCEGINSFIKRYVQQKNSLVDFLHNFERAVKEYRHNELMADFKSSYADPVLTTPLHKIELYASKIYTRNKFKEVKNELEECGALNVIDRLVVGDSVQFKMNRFGKPNREHVVVLQTVDRKFGCECRLFESHGIPCRHIFCAMKHEHIDVIPNSLILKRWTKNAKADYMAAVSNEEHDLDKLVLLRSGALSASCNRLCNLASRDRDDFLEIRSEIHKLTLKLENRRGGKSTQNTDPNAIRDPDVVKTKGAPRKRKYNTKRRRCSHCKRIGHNISTCRLLREQDGLCSIDEQVSDSEVDGNLQISENANVTQEEDGTQHTSSVQASAHIETSVDVQSDRKRKKMQKMISTTQNSVKHLDKPPRDDKVQSVALTKVAQGSGSSTVGLRQNVPPIYGQNLPIFPQYPGFTVYTNVIPQYPIVPQYPLYPQHYGFGPEHPDARRK